MVNHVVTNGPQQRSLTAPTAAPAAVAPPAVVAPAVAPVVAPVPGVIPLVSAVAPLATVGTAPVGVPSAFTPTAPPAGKKGLDRLRRK